MAWSKLDVINLAFSLLNKSSVGDVVNSGVFADSASRAYELLFPSSISGKSWRFATTSQELNQLVTEPPIDRWQYQYQLPSDYLAAVRTYPRMDFQIYGDKLYSNHNAVVLEYRFQPDITHCPAYYIHYLAYVIAAWYADSVAENEKLAERLLTLSDRQLGEALFTDSQSHPTPSMENNPVILSRMGGWYNDGRC